MIIKVKSIVQLWKLDMAELNMAELNIFGCPPYFGGIKMIRTEKWLHFLCSFRKRSRNSKMKVIQFFLSYNMSHMFRFGLLCSYSEKVKRGLHSPPVVGRSE